MVYLHGNSGSRLSGKYLVKYLLPLKIGVLTFDFAGCGMSEGTFITLGKNESLDLKSVIRNLKKQYP